VAAASVVPSPAMVVATVLSDSEALSAVVTVVEVVVEDAVCSA